MANLQTVESWETALGLIAFPLRGHRAVADGRVVLLNGTRGNLCLNVHGQKPNFETRSEIWSSDIGHYVSVESNDVYVQRWDRPASALERYRLEQVRENLSKFHRYLSDAEPVREKSVVVHALRVFRQLREVGGKDVPGEVALEGFLALIASAALELSPSELERGSLLLSPRALEFATSIRPADWAALQTRLTSERPVDQLQPDLDLVLRHAAGPVFQEAHYEALFHSPDQLRLDGFIPNGVDRGSVHAKSQGVHYTPSALARTVVEFTFRAVPPSHGEDVEILDPACGSAEFLREAVRQLKRLDYSGKIRLVGIDISQGACSTAAFLLDWEFSSDEDIEVTIWCGDALSEDAPWPANAKYIFMNPPFVNWRDMTVDQQDCVRTTIGDAAGPRPDLAMAFLWKASGRISAEGAIGSVVPASILDGMSAAGLRRRLQDAAPPAVTARLGSHSIFPNATVDAGVYIGSRNPVHPPFAVWADHRPASASRAFRTLRKSQDRHDGVPLLEIGEGFSAYEAPDLFANAEHGWAPRPYNQWQLKRTYSSLKSVGDLFDVQQGTITGRNDVFLLTLAEYERLPEQERPYFRPAITNGSIVGGRLQPKVYVFYPYGEFDIPDETELRGVVPTFFADVLVPSREKLLERSRVTESNWWRLSEHRSWQVKTRPKLASTYFGDVGSFAYDEVGDAVIVQGYGWSPIRAHRRFARSIALAYLAIVNSRMFSDLMAASSSNLESGAYNLSKRYVEGIPIPHMFHDAFPVELRAALAEVGGDVVEGGLSSFSEQMRRRHAELVEAAYQQGGL